jgi:hypothetical protein
VFVGFVCVVFVCVVFVCVMHSSSHRASHADVLEHAHAIITHLTAIEKCVETLVSSITDDSLVFALISYIDSGTQDFGFLVIL